jgi:hypothetical protein
VPLQRKRRREASLIGSGFFRDLTLIGDRIDSDRQSAQPVLGKKSVTSKWARLKTPRNLEVTRRIGAELPRRSPKVFPVGTLSIGQIPRIGGKAETANEQRDVKLDRPMADLLVRPKSSTPPYIVLIRIYRRRSGSEVKNTYPANRTPAVASTVVKLTTGFFMRGVSFSTSFGCTHHRWGSRTRTNFVAAHLDGSLALRVSPLNPSLRTDIPPFN